MAGKSPQMLFRRTTCVHHKGRQVQLFCKSCDQGACVKCVSSVHQSHTICDLAEVLSQKKIDILDFITNTETTELVQTEEHIKSTEKLIRDNSVHFQKLESELKKQNEKLKQELDLLMIEKLALYKRMTDENAVILNTYKSNLESYKVQINQLLEECKSALQRGSDLEIYDIRCEIRSVTQPKSPTLGMASLTLNPNPRRYLEQALGTSVTVSGPDHASADHDRSVEPSDQKRPGASSTRQRVPSDEMRTVTRQPSQYTLLPQTKILREFESPCEISSLCPSSDGGAWASYCDSPTLTLLDRRGKTKQGIKYNNNITDISLSRNTHSLWSCHEDDNSIMELLSGKPTLRFNVASKPWCICVTGDGHIIVGMEKGISKFTTKGKVVLSGMAAGAGKPLLSTPYRVSECRLTGNVAVADWDDISHGCDGKPHVLVMDKNLQELFRYRGVIPGNSQQTIQVGSSPFDPYGLVYDRVGNLIIGDSDNKRVILINGQGQFLRSIHIDKRDDTWAVGIDRNDLVWAVFGWGNVKLLQYTNMGRRCTIF